MEDLGYDEFGGFPGDAAESTTLPLSYSEQALRWLKDDKEKEEEPLDYSVLSVGVMTLGLILFVEVIRHKLDHMAITRPFFKVVLEATYSELATLGIVELFIFLLMRYYELQNKERKEVFAEVHFALFYTAIFNAFQSVICGFFTRLNSTKLWVQTEHLELDHYVEIREAFEQVSNQYYSHRQQSQRDLSLGARICAWIQKPALRRKYMNLLVQVRFHELRIQFLETNRLPLNLKVSDYLKRAEEGVLMHMVHVSGTAWLMLTAGFNLLYFGEGLIANITGDAQAVGRSMAGIFFGMLILFIVICVVVYIKMKSIFEKIIKMKHSKGKGNGNETDPQSGAANQKSFFWFNEPQLVIALIQFMQFGYAIALALVIMFWTDLGEVASYIYLLAVLGCYSIFVFVLTKVLPQFTLCTSLGHLVNKEHLNETLAIHRLDEEKLKLKRKLVQLTFQKELEGDDSSFVCVTNNMPKNQDSERQMVAIAVDGNCDKLPSTSALLSEGESLTESSTSRTNSHHLINSGQQTKVIKNLSSGALTIEDSISQPSHSSGDSAIHSTTPKETSSLLAELVKMDTAALRAQLPDRDKNRLSEREKFRANRQKSNSDGVQGMRGGLQKMVSSKALSTEDAELERQKKRQERRANRKKAISASSVIQQWRTHVDDKKGGNKKNDLSSINEHSHHTEDRQKSNSASEVIQRWQHNDDGSSSSTGASGGPKFTLKEHPTNSSVKTTDDPTLTQQRLRRENRKKAVSASAVIQSWRDFSVSSTGPSMPSASHPSAGSLQETMDLHDIHETPEHLDEEEEDEAPFSMDAPDLLATERHDNTTVVDLSKAHLVEEESENPTVGKKSVGFSDDLEIPESDDGNSLILSKPVGVEGNDDDDDNNTVDTGKSVGELSDVGVAMSEYESVRSQYQEEETRTEKICNALHPTALRKSFHDFFISEAHQAVSHIFGSIVVFFLIGMRLEAFNAETGAYQSSENTWELRINVSFWWQVSMYMAFIIMSCLALWSVNPSECRSVPERRAFAAAVIDLILCVSCFTFLLAAEAQRCCEDESTLPTDEGVLANGGRRLMRILAGDGSTESTSLALDSEEDCCPFWGNRTYGGYGAIEPFTALIGLRVLRFHLARWVAHRMQKAKSSKEDISTDQEQSSEGHDDHGHGGHGHGHGAGDTTTAVDLWQRAITAHPHIAAKYGEFSSELFQTMLGLDVIDNDDHAHASVATKSISSEIPTGMTHSVSLLDMKDPSQIAQVEDPSIPHYKLGEQYSNLSADCQGIILAGKLGKPVKSMPTLTALVDPSSDDELPILHEEGHTKDEQGEQNIKSIVTKDVEFEVDSAQLAQELDEYSSFIAPNARLTRSMRRCDRKLYPLLKEWTTVDVVMTDYEIVYFEVSDENDSELAPDVLQKKEALKLALQATKGGKGLRLLDVAAGRKVVGHMDLSDIMEVHVERDMPLTDVSHLEAMEDPNQISGQVASEYWLKSNHIEVHTASRDLRFAKVKEDRLKIIYPHGTLFLRYYSDLLDVESHLEMSQAENETSGTLKKDIAFQWAQTLVHICGTAQLKQPLPHYGANDSEELRDYMEVVHHKSDETKQRRRNLASGFSRTFSTKDLTSENAQPQVPGRAPISQRQSSTDSAAGGRQKSSMRFFRRTVSTGEYDQTSAGIAADPLTEATTKSLDLEAGGSAKPTEATGPNDDESSDDAPVFA